MSVKPSPNDRLERLTALAEQIASAMNLGVLDAKFGQQGKNRTVEVTIYRKPGGVSLSDCEEFSRQLDAELEDSATSDDAIIDGAYMLEVQSPGLDRVLKNEREYDIFSGEKVQVQAKEKVEGLGHTFVGRLGGVVNGMVRIVQASKPVEAKAKGKAAGKPVETTDLELPTGNIASIKLVVDLSQTKDAAEAELETDLN